MKHKCSELDIQPKAARAKAALKHFKVLQLVLKNLCRPIPADPTQGEVELWLQGLDYTGAFQELINSIVENSLNIVEASYELFGDDNCFFEARIKAVGPLVSAEHVSLLFEIDAFVVSPEGDVPQARRVVPSRACSLMHIDMNCLDEVGALLRFASCLTKPESAGDLLRDLKVKEAAPIAQRGTIIDLHARSVNDAEFSMGGTPGFAIHAVVALPREHGQEWARERLQGFRSDFVSSDPVIKVEEGSDQEYYQFAAAELFVNN